MVTKEDIKKGLIDLGLKGGDLVLVHSALASLGKVEGGADTVIDALLEVLGPKGTLMMPTLSGGIFKREESPSGVGIITETFRKRPDVSRSLHPTHSVAAKGFLAEKMLADHEKSDTASGVDTPFGRNATNGGYILLLGVDQDRNTTLHTVEEYADAPWLSDRSGQYYDDNGEIHTIHMKKFPGPHRDFIGVDRILRETGVEKIGKVGNAVCRLIKAKEMIQTALAAFEKDPALVLCDNPNCGDCMMQRGKLKAHQLENEDFTLTAIVNDLDPNYAEIARLVQTEGISEIEIGADLGASLLVKKSETVAKSIASSGLKVASLDAKLGRISLADDIEYHLHTADKAIELAKELGCQYIKTRAFIADESFPEGGIKTASVWLKKMAAKADSAGLTLLIENAPGTHFDLLDHCSELISAMGDANFRVAFNPANFAAKHENPFLRVFYRGKMKRRIGQLVVNDGLWDGTRKQPGQGNAEIKELISILRCRSFSGFMAIDPIALGTDAFHETAKAFWKLLENM